MIPSNVILTSLILLEISAITIISVYAVRHYVYSLLCVRCVRKLRKREGDVGDKLYPSPMVSVLVPARNEENVIRDILSSLVIQDYPRDKIEILVINDGSTDNTGAIAREFSKKYKGLVRVVDIREGGKGKANAVNIGIDHARGEIILVFDADYVVDSNCVRELVRQLISTNSDIVQGRIIPYNAERLIARVVALERMVGYACEFVVRDHYGLFVQYAGTVGGFRREVIEKLGKWDINALAEDTDLTCRATIQGFKIKYANNVVGFEQAVEDLWSYILQRFRWAKGHILCFLNYSTKILTSKSISLIKKIDSLIVLFLYMMPISWLFSTIYIVLSIIFGAPPFYSIIPLIPSWLMLVFWFFIFGGLFVESVTTIITQGVSLRRFIIPLLLIPVISHILAIFFIAALVDILVDVIFRKGRHTWIKTEKKKGIVYVENLAD